MKNMKAENLNSFISSMLFMVNPKVHMGSKTPLDSVRLEAATT
ncbi:MAG: hypothetical protein AAGA58_02915 [Verrucomicrobiota bacterium]